MKLDQILKHLGSVKCDGNKDRVGIKGPLRMYNQLRKQNKKILFAAAIKKKKKKKKKTSLITRPQ